MKKITFGFLIILCTAISLYAGAFIDVPIPGTEGGNLASRVEAGTGEGDFHVTYEIAEKGTFYINFDGAAWSNPIKVHSDAAFRSGTPVGIDSSNNVHFAWVPGGYTFTGEDGDAGTKSNELHFIRNVFACPLKIGVFIDRCTDVGRLENVYFNPNFW